MKTVASRTALVAAVLGLGVGAAQAAAPAAMAAMPDLFQAEAPLPLVAGALLLAVLRVVQAVYIRRRRQGAARPALAYARREPSAARPARAGAAFIPAEQ